MYIPYRWPEDYFPITASCCLPTDEDYDYDASSEEFWGTPNSSTTSPLSVEVSETRTALLLTYTFFLLNFKYTISLKN